MTPQLLISSRALTGIDTLPPADRADVWEAVAAVLAGIHPAESAEAGRIAGTIREAEAAQLKFSALLAQSVHALSS